MVLTRPTRNGVKREIHRQAFLANRAAIAMENARLCRRVEEEAMLRGSLYEVGKLMSSILELDHVLAVISRQAVRLTGAETGMITLLNEETHLLGAKGFSASTSRTNWFRAFISV